MKINLPCLLFLCSLSPQVIGSEFYGWTDELKRTHYTDFKPPPGKTIEKVFAYCLRSEPETPSKNPELERQSAEPEKLSKNPEIEKQSAEPDKASKNLELEKQKSGCFVLSQDSPVQVILLVR